MIADLYSLVGLFKTETLTFTRRAAGPLSSGFVTPGAVSTYRADAVVHPLTGRELQALPEGQRTRDPVAVFLTVEPRTASEPGGAPADTFTRGGATYEIQRVEAWNLSGGFWRAVAVKVPVA